MLEQALEQLGVRTHIDHFGTGASPLRLLHRFPGDAIKVSPALVAGIGHDAGAFEIVRAVVGLAHNLGLEVIAEGVEKREQLDYLKVLGCEFAQGFHISPTLTAEEARALLESTAPSHLPRLVARRRVAARRARRPRRGLVGGRRGRSTRAGRARVVVERAVGLAAVVDAVAVAVA